MIYQDYLDGKGCRPIWRNPKTYTAGTQIIMGVDNNNTCQVTYTATNSNTASDLRIQIWQLGASNFANSLNHLKLAFFLASATLLTFLNV